MESAQTSSLAPYRSYLIGLALAAVLTIIPFTLVATRPMAPSAILAIIGVCGVIQVFVQLKYFLHLGFSGPMTRDTWIFGVTVLFMALMVGGSIWIMMDLDRRM